MIPTGAFSVFMLAASICQFVGQVAFSVLVETRSKQASNATGGRQISASSTTLSRKVGRAVFLSDLRQGGIIVSVLSFYVFEVFFFIQPDFYTDAIQLYTKPIRSFLNANIKDSSASCLQPNLASQKSQSQL
ncbi:hypothetical protein BC830DRAFT_172012 [Chytriomyces sp. MP71]|nr:hypothetical protein BC830DRAFT_172012 [Chytriomyces sp. MP71]